MLALRPLMALAMGVLVSQGAWSKARLNSMCYLEDRTKAEVKGSNSQRLYEIASLSKIVTSFWALKNLGPYYRFKTRLYVAEVSDGVYDVHVAGGRDPYFGREMTHFLVSELYRLNIRAIRNLSFDENFVFNWTVRERPVPSYSVIPLRTEAWLKDRLKFDARQYTATRKYAQSMGVSMEPAPQVRIGNIHFLAKSEFAPTGQFKTIELKSVTLVKYLKEMNRVSNNHVADRLFEFLGGTNAFQAFIKKELDFTLEDIRFVNGSGDSYTIENTEGQKKKVYNEASCDALVHVLDSTRTLLKKSGLDLEDIMAVSGQDAKSTLKGRYANPSISGAMVAKTGTVNPAVALAGMISTEKGDVYFGILYGTDGPADWRRGRDAIRNQVGSLMGKYGGKETIRGYHSQAFLPFDASSKLSFLTSAPVLVAPSQPQSMPAVEINLTKN